MGKPVTAVGIAVLVLVMTVMFAVCAVGGWLSNGNPICTATDDQYVPRLVSDGTGGAIITWADWRAGSDDDIYAQRVDACGSVKWAVDGVAICTATKNQGPSDIISDGAGGAIIVWGDDRSGNPDIYAQRVDASGSVKWALDGIAVCTATNGQSSARLVSDGTGGVIITWEDYRSGSDDDIYAQRVDASGSVKWAVDGVAICTAAKDRFRPQIVSDGAGGAIITWEDYRSGEDIYAQRVDASGVVRWAVDGVAICTAMEYQNQPQLVSDGAGGAIITWSDFRTGTCSDPYARCRDIYAQRVDASGSVRWAVDGVAICTAVDDQHVPQLVSDGAGGAIIVWYDHRSGNDDIYVQRVDASGSVKWAVDGVAICTADYQQELPQIASDGGGGGVITWVDHRSGAPLYYSDVYAQRVSGSGAIEWNANGVAVSTAANHQAYPQLVSDGGEGAIITWQDRREGVYWDIYALRVAGGGMPTVIAFVSVSAGATRGEVTLLWQIAIDASALSFHVKRSEAPEGQYTDLDLAVVKDSQYSFSCIDGGVSSGRTYWYRIVLTSSSGEESYGPIEVHVDAVPTAYATYQSYPNPFNPVCTIRYEIPKPGRVSLQVYDIVGKPVRTLVDAWREPGVYSEVWDGRADDGRALPSGIYFYRLKAGDFVATRKMVLLH